MAHILPKLTSSVPSAATDKNAWVDFDLTPLAGPHFYSPGKIDILLGSDVYGRILEGGFKKGIASGSIAQLTSFGWVISGPTNSPPQIRLINTLHSRIDHDLDQQLERFWLQEEIEPSSRKPLSLLDEECENHFVTTHTRDSSGRYVVRLPFKKPIENLGDSLPQAYNSLRRLQRKFETDSVLYDSYSSFLLEYERLHHMIRVPESNENPSSVFYLPHHGVMQCANSTPKIRVVFNGSCSVATGSSINDLLHCGPKLQSDITEVLLWMRRFKYVFSCDVEKMYRQMQLNPDDCNFQRILWLEGDKIIHYFLTTVTYGLSCAPFLALRIMVQLVHDEGSRFPLATDILIKGRYVDDMFGGGDTIQEAQSKVDQLVGLCTAGGFPLRKWTANVHKVIDSISSHSNRESAPLTDDTCVQALGLKWDPKMDNFSLSSELQNQPLEIWSKRKVLSTIAKSFDPLGFLSPMYIQAKIFMQELWSLRLKWDAPLPSLQLTRWRSILNQYEGSDTITIPRWLGTTS